MREVIGKIGIVAALAGAVLWIDRQRANPTFALLGKADALAVTAAGIAVWYLSKKGA